MDRDELAAAAPELIGDLLRFARSLTRDPALAEDLVQETFARALAGLHGCRGDAALRTWLHRILYHLAVDRARRSSRELLVDEVEDAWRDDAYTVDPEVVVARAAERAELDDALGAWRDADSVVPPDLASRIADALGASQPARGPG